VPVHALFGDERRKQGKPVFASGAGSGTVRKSLPDLNAETCGIGLSSVSASDVGCGRVPVQYIGQPFSRDAGKRTGRPIKNGRDFAKSRARNKAGPPGRPKEGREIMESWDPTKERGVRRPMPGRAEAPFFRPTAGSRSCLFLRSFFQKLLQRPYINLVIFLAEEGHDHLFQGIRL